MYGMFVKKHLNGNLTIGKDEKNRSAAYRRDMEEDTEYLVFSPGGVYGFAHVGALQALEQKWSKQGKNLHKCIRGVAGSSIGAVVALAFVLGYRGIELQQFASEQLNELSVILEKANLVHLYNTMGMMSEQPIALFVSRLMMRKIGRDDVTFAELNDIMLGPDLVFGVHNVDTFKGVLFSTHTTPDVPVLKACVMSCLIPIIFEPMVHNGHVHVDGGLSNSLPYDLFPPEKTLAIHLSKVPGHTPLSHMHQHKFITYIAMLIEAYETATKVKMMYNPPRHYICIKLTVCSLSPLMADTQKQAHLVALGMLNVQLYDQPIELIAGLVYIIKVCQEQGAAATDTDSTDVTDAQHPTNFEEVRLPCNIVDVLHRCGKPTDEPCPSKTL